MPVFVTASLYQTPEESTEDSWPYISKQNREMHQQKITEQNPDLLLLTYFNQCMGWDCVTTLGNFISAKHSGTP